MYVSTSSVSTSGWQRPSEAAKLVFSEATFQSTVFFRGKIVDTVELLLAEDQPVADGRCISHGILC
jgi:hypothetical protein